MKYLLRSKWNPIFEFLFAAAVLLALCNVIAIYYSSSYLPQPFFDESSDTFMDWYNTTYWSYRAGVYSEWGSIYPPLSFVFLRIFSISACYEDSADAGRECDPVGAWVLCGFTILNVILIYLNYRKSDNRTAIPRTIALGVGLPALFALERGNLIVPCFTCFILAQGHLLRSAWLRMLCFGLAANFKPYLVVVVAGKLFRRKWRWAEGCAIATILVYLVSYLILGRGTPFEILSNELVFSGTPDHLGIDYMTYATTYNAMLDFTKSLLPLMHFLGSRPLETVEHIFPILIKIGFLGVFVCYIGAFWRPRALSSHRIAALSLILFYSMTKTAGEYAEVFLFFLLFFEKWKGAAQITVLICVYILCVPWDLILVKIVHASTFSYLSGRAISYDFGVTLGSVVRPGIILIMEYALVVASLMEIYRAGLPRPGQPVGAEPVSYLPGAPALAR